MPTSMEATVCVFRCGDEHYKYGDPYEFAMLIQIINKVAYFSSGIGKFKPEWRRDLFKKLLDLGVLSAEWERKRKDGTSHVVKFETSAFHKYV